MAAEPDLAQLRAEEEELQFDRFDHDMAFALGTWMRQRALEAGLGIVIDVTLTGRQLFFCALPGTGPDNSEWVRRKVATVMRFGHSSLSVRIECQAAGKTLKERSHLDPSDFVWDGGSFPIILKGTGVVGAVTVSGLPDVEDHRFVVEGLRHLLGATSAGT